MPLMEQKKTLIHNLNDFISIEGCFLWSCYHKELSFYQNMLPVIPFLLPSEDALSFFFFFFLEQHCIYRKIAQKVQSSHTPLLPTDSFSYFNVSL